MAEKESQGIVAALPMLTLLILFVSVSSFIFPEIASVFVFDRNAILQGEVWRLFSSHFVHFSGTHLIYNLLAFGVAGWIVEGKSRLRFGLLYVLMAMVISVSLFIFRPAMSCYGGLSGMACGFILYCALQGAQMPGPWRTVSKLIILLLPVKIALEIYTSASILPYWERQAFVTMPMSHAAGMAVAFLFYLAMEHNREDSYQRLGIDQQACRLPSN